VQTLAGGSRITNLNLSGNNIGDAGAKALAEMLKVGVRCDEEREGGGEGGRRRQEEAGKDRKQGVES
jgi:hypothetical protein